MHLIVATLSFSLFFILFYCRSLPDISQTPVARLPAFE